MVQPTCAPISARWKSSLTASSSWPCLARSPNARTAGVSTRAVTRHGSWRSRRKLVGSLIHLLVSMSSMNALSDGMSRCIIGCNGWISRVAPPATKIVRPTAQQPKPSRATGSGGSIARSAHCAVAPPSLGDTVTTSERTAVTLRPTAEKSVLPPRTAKWPSDAPSATTPRAPCTLAPGWAGGAVVISTGSHSSEAARYTLTWLENISLGMDK
mmetsp:Transcript_5399/g.17535  ORF Transcript_5399/g.17535 Transcript_5399/m.17535 type:complete len:213 (+) Transcript_5399:157-795(+)